MERIAGLSSPNFIEISDESHTYYGGDQGWWKDASKRFESYGCGAISMSDTELYIMKERKISRDRYLNFVNKRFKKLYHFLIARGVPFWKMCLGFWRTLRAKSINSFVWWAPSIRKSKLLYYMEEMLSKDMPIPASYFVFIKRNGLPLYRYNDSLNVFTYSQDIHSHYFTITGIYLDSASKNKYLEISSWGQRFYIEFDAWSKKRSLFTNILYYRIKSL